jgi:transposase
MRPSAEQISRIGKDTSKLIFQLHGVNAAEAAVLRKKLSREEMIAFFKALAPTVIAIEACGASHHWARLLQSFGHGVKLIAPQLVKPYVKRGKNDAAETEALCEAMSGPTMRLVPVKTAEQQAALMLIGVRDRLISNRTQLSNAIRGYAAEFGLTAAKGKAHLDLLLEAIRADESLPMAARELFAAWIGLTPKNHSTAGKVRLGVITRAGDEALHSAPVVGATSVIQQAQRSGKASPWLAELLKRKPPKLVAATLANKMASVAWKLMVTGQSHKIRACRFSERRLEIGQIRGAPSLQPC